MGWFLTISCGWILRRLEVAFVTRVFSCKVVGARHRQTSSFRIKVAVGTNHPQN